jgi:flagellar assembly factor FliW
MHVESEIKGIWIKKSFKRKTSNYIRPIIVNHLHKTTLQYLINVSKFTIKPRLNAKFQLKEINHVCLQFSVQQS